jgi:hypothetical protein
MLTRHPQGFPDSHPCPAFPSPVATGRVQGPLGFPVSSAPGRCRPRTSRAGTGLKTLTRSHAVDTVDLQSTDSLTTSDLMSQALRIPPRVGMSDHLAPFALWTALPSALAGRNSCDYYGPPSP